MKKIYFNNRSIGVSNNLEACAKKLNSVVCKVTNNFNISEIIEQFLTNEQLYEYYLYTEDEAKIFAELCAQFTMIEAAGGLVRNSHGDVLMIYRNGHWDLPKGKRDKNENLSETALREVEEECGIGDLNLYDLISTSYHTYRENDTIILKATSWYSMTHSGHALPIPQTIEGIDKAKWVPVTNLKDYQNSYYPSIYEILCKAGLLHSEEC